MPDIQNVQLDTGIPCGFGVLTVGEDGTSGVTIDSVEVSGNFVNRGRVGGFEVITDTFTGSGCTGARFRPVSITNTRILGNSGGRSSARKNSLRGSATFFR